MILPVNAESTNSLTDEEYMATIDAEIEYEKYIDDTLSGDINPDTYDKLLTMEKNIRDQLYLKSQMTETMNNAVDYWCLNDHLFSIVESKYDDGYLEHPATNNTQKIVDILNEKYNVKDNFTNFEPGYRSKVIADVVKPNTVWLLMDADNPLKMSIAQEILDDHGMLIMRSIIPESPSLFADSCKEPLERMLGINIVQNPEVNNHKWINIRGDIVSIKPQSVIELFERDYLVVKTQLYLYE